MTLLYVLEILGTVVFAISGVFAVTRRGLDVIGALALGMVTALGGGTVRDLIIGAAPFWIVDSTYLWAAAAGSLVAFSLGALIHGTQRGVLAALGSWPAVFRGYRRYRHLRNTRTRDLQASRDAWMADARAETRRVRRNCTTQSEPRGCAA